MSLRKVSLSGFLLLLPFAFSHAQPTDEFDPAGSAQIVVPSTLPARGVGPTPLHDNGPFITGIGTGPGGADASVVQNSTLGMTTLGAANQLADNNRMADQFTVTGTAPWRLDELVVYSYQTGSPTTSTINAVTVQVYDAAPNAGGSVLFGDTTTNRLTSSTWTGVYRFSQTTIDTTRPIMASTVNLGGLVLQPGTYWIDWSVGGSLASGPWQPPITIIGQNTTGDALQFFTGAWQAFLDGGTSTPQGIPFLLFGEVLEGDLTVTPGALDFGLVTVGTSGTGSVTLGNDGDTSLQVTAIDAASAPFAATGGSCGAVPITLAPAATCTLQYSFSPTVPGAAAQVIALTADAPGATSFTLQGEGESAGVPVEAVPLPAGSTLTTLLLTGFILFALVLALRRRRA